MTAVWMRARSELAERWRSLVSLALIAGLGGAVVIAAFAGARRTASAYPRFLKATRAYDVLLSDTRSQDSGPGQGPSQEEQIAMMHRVQAAHFPALLDSTIVELYNVEVVSPSGDREAFPGVFPVASEDGKMATTINSIKLLRGRQADPARADEAVTNPTVASRLGVDVGSVVELQGKGPMGAPVSRPVKIVGIGEVAGQVDPTSGGFIPALLLTPAFYREGVFNAIRQDPVLMVRAGGGSRGLTQLLKEIQDARLPLATNILQAPQTAGLLRSSRFAVVGLQVFGGLAALTILAVFGQLLTRQIFIESDEHEWLHALGMTRGQLMLLTFVRVLIMALAASVIAIIGAILLSPLTPIGTMRPLEVSPGIRLDVLTLTLGFVGIMLVTSLVAAVPAWLTTSFATRRQKSEITSNVVAKTAARAAFPPSIVTGIHLGLEPGRGKTAVPIRTAIFGMSLAVAALIAALSFGSGLSKLVSSPALSGWNFDFVVGDAQPRIDVIDQKLKGDGTIVESVFGTITDVRIGGIQPTAFAMQPGSFGESLVSGRLPLRSDEIALGPKTMRDVHTAVGKTIVVTILDPNTSQPLGKPVSMRVVGSVVVPQFFFSGRNPGDGSAITYDLIRSLAAPSTLAENVGMWVRLRPGVSLDAAEQKIRQLGSPSIFIVRRATSADLQNLQRVSNLPSILAGLLAMLGAATLVHTLATSVRRRRRDLAILKTLGFVRGQVRAAVAWQTTTLIVIALIVGIPLGAIAGRWGWRVFVNQLGFVPQPVVPLLAVFLTIPAALLLANAIASVPARAAARTQPAVALRAE